MSYLNKKLSLCFQASLNICRVHIDINLKSIFQTFFLPQGFKVRLTIRKNIFFFNFFLNFIHFKFFIDNELFFFK